MTPRLGGFPEEAAFGTDQVWLPEQATGRHGTIRSSLPPGPEREALLHEIMASLRERAGDPTALVAELRDLLAGKDLTQLINAVAVPASMSVIPDAGSGALDDGPYTWNWAAKIEYLVGIALSVDSSGTEDSPRSVVEQVVTLVGAIFEAEEARIFINSIDEADDDGAELGFARMQLQMEHLSDRMPGYAMHMETIDTEVFNRHRQYYIKALGFNPADVMRIIRQHSQAVRKRFSSAVASLRASVDSGDEADVSAFVEGLNAASIWTVAAVSQSTGSDVDEVRAMLEFFSTTYGCQPDFRFPGDDNIVRKRPCITLGDGQYLIPDPWALPTALHDRLATESKTATYDPVKYHKHRQDAHERLVEAVLTRIFGKANVHAGQHYTSATRGEGEIDVLVSTEWPLVVEAKAHSLTEAGRRGRRDRVTSRVDDMLGKALDQTDRATTYILEEDGRAFSLKQRGKMREILPSDVSGVTSIVVTFERMDPIATYGAAIAGSARRPTWVLGVGDLLVVADLLPDPAAFHHYARLRAAMADDRVIAACESDVLGSYFYDRVQPLLTQESDGQVLRVVGYASGQINRYYSNCEMEIAAAEAPTTGVPSDIAVALSTTVDNVGWADCAQAVMLAEPSTWTKWKRFTRRHKGKGEFKATERLTITTSGDHSAVEALDGISLLRVSRADLD
ncbi:hypothetical protein IU470_27300 [Nocardia abscessus]|uniref:Preprotein translocase subunit SecA n=1 Tax=Nocardia abscessus TaxID=120957 RepID=A0ABS0CEM6_9NOCA|nr:hypothetical protein [Nocardia abscessus]MBF6228795.1 hypothetical protein [Nocardia abscessus]